MIFKISFQLCVLIALLAALLLLVSSSKGKLPDENVFSAL